MALTWLTESKGIWSCLETPVSARRAAVQKMTMRRVYITTQWKRKDYKEFKDEGSGGWGVGNETKSNNPKLGLREQLSRRLRHLPRDVSATGLSRLSVCVSGFKAERTGLCTVASSNNRGLHST